MYVKSIKIDREQVIINTIFIHTKIKYELQKALFLLYAKGM